MQKSKFHTLLCDLPHIIIELASATVCRQGYLWLVVLGGLIAPDKLVGLAENENN